MYEGDFVKGKMEGKGEFFKLNDTCYDGNWKENLPHGKGITHDKNGRIIYDGDFIWGEADGNGKLNYKNGDYYIGKLSKGKRNGKGILFDKDGNIKYDENFKDDKYGESTDCIIF